MFESAKTRGFEGKRLEIDLHRILARYNTDGPAVHYVIKVAHLEDRYRYMTDSVYQELDPELDLSPLHGFKEHFREIIAKGHAKMYQDQYDDLISGICTFS